MSDSRKDRRDKRDRFDKRNTKSDGWAKSRGKEVDEFEEEKFDWRKYTQIPTNASAIDTVDLEEQ
jgi:hypothetical protein